MDFYRISETSPKKDVIELRPEFIVSRSKDLMVRGKSFYAIWDESRGMWSTDEYDVVRIVDRDLFARRDEVKKYAPPDTKIVVKTMANFSSGVWNNFQNYLNKVSDNSVQLDSKLTFQNTDVKKSDYVSRRLPYSLCEGECPAYNELITTLYDEEERKKIEWAIGCVIAGDSADIQKFIVFYGEAGAGKSTMLNIIQKLFEGYYTTFEAKALTSSNNAFSTEVFKSNPLVAIQHDGDLSKIEDNTKLNSIVSHEEMVLNEKYKPSYTSRINAFLFMATNRPVKITDAKSGIIRRLIDVGPSGRKIPSKRYFALMSQIDFELGPIANHCLNVYREMGKNYYNNYRPFNMIMQTDVFFNFVEEYYYTFKKEDSITLTQAYDMYKSYCESSYVEYKLPRYKFREELKNYFREFYPVTRIDGKQVRSYYSGFIFEKFLSLEEPKIEEHPCQLVLDQTVSLLDEFLAECPAQYANDEGIPRNKWSKVKTVLDDIDTTKLHYVKVPANHIVIDFDLRNEKGEKSYEKNLEAASEFPPTYAEVSKSGAGIHLHYIFDGPVEKLSPLYKPGIEIKRFEGDSSLRRKLTKCNNIPVATISSGLPLKGKKMVNFEAIKSEKVLRAQIEKNLRKQIHPDTRSSINFIHKILSDAYDSGLHYDVTDMRQSILVFANNSTHNADYCVKLVDKMKFKSDEPSPAVDSEDDRIVFFDVEVFPNLFLINWKYDGAEGPCVRMVNPSPKEVGEFLKMKLVGFNCRRYDNHIVYARYLGYDNYELFKLSQKIINGSANCFFSEAYNASYTDVYDFASSADKKSLKKWEIELGIHHQELGLPWDEPVPEDMWETVAEYCDNDVMATEVVFHHLKADWTARQILAELSGLSPNHTTNQHSTRIIFGANKNPQNEFVYTDLSEMFPGYEFDNGKSTYRGEETGEGGYVYAEPGMYKNVALLDIASMHPTSIEQLNLFGPYTKRFSELKQARIYIKHNEFDKARQMMDGKLAPYLDDESQAKDLANALKTVINSVYGLTSAKFDNAFRDPRNIDNIVAKRGALFMIDLKHAVQEKGYTVAHIKTDSIKIPDADSEIIQFVMDFGKKYGYTFEHEATYNRMCLVNNAVYIAKLEDGTWSATGAQFAHPYVFKTLFSHEPIEFRDLCETKNVSTSIYLDMNEGLGEDEHNYVFVGKVGLFCPIKEGCGGGVLCREKDGKYYAVGGTKDYRWMESEMVKTLDKEDDIDYSYFGDLVNSAIENISNYGSFEKFVS